MRAHKHVFLENGSKIFVAQGLSNPIGLNRLTKLVCRRREFCGPLRRRAQSIRQNQATDLPDASPIRLLRQRHP
jgi:hypothetical protein